MPTSSKRQLLAQRLARLGLLRVLEWFRRPCLLVLAYHRIASRQGYLLDDGVLSASPEDFTAQMKYVRDHFDLPSVESIIRTAEAGFRFTRPTALVTFDDGYRDNLECALPILRAAQVPALFFVCPRFVTARHLPYWDWLAYAFKKTAVRSFAVDYPFPHRVNLAETTPARGVMDYLQAVAGHAQPIDEERWLAEVQERTEVRVPVDELLDRLFMSWDEVRRLAEGGMAVGSHCLTHPALGHLGEAEQRHELTRSKAILEQELAAPVATLAYPFGSRNDLSKRLAKEAAYRLGFSYPGGVNPPGHADLFDIRRVAVDSDVTFPMFRARTACYQAFGRSFF